MRIIVGLWAIHHLCDCGCMDSLLCFIVGLWTVSYVHDCGSMDGPL